MHQKVTAEVAAPADRVAGIIGDLATYPDWLALVVTASPEPGDDGTWLVTIRATVGPFARSKKLRMARTLHESTDGVSRFRFERQEIDGRNHSPWTLDASVRPTSESSSLVTMDLHYGGRLWTAPLEPVLGSFIDDAGPGLEAYATQS